MQAHTLVVPMNRMLSVLILAHLIMSVRHLVTNHQASLLVTRCDGMQKGCKTDNNIESNKILCRRRTAPEAKDSSAHII